MLVEIPRTAAHPEIPQITAEEASAAARAVVTLFEKWQLPDTNACEILGGLITPKVCSLEGRKSRSHQQGPGNAPLVANWHPQGATDALYQSRTRLQQGQQTE